MTSKDELREDATRLVKSISCDDNAKFYPDGYVDAILNLLEGEKRKAFTFGQRVGQYQAADKMYEMDRDWETPYASHLLGD